MRYFVLATDYDGTLAHKGRVDDQTIASIRKLRDSGRIPVLVTGRQIEELLGVFPAADIFEAIVAENGALLYSPANRKEILLGDPVPNTLVALLRKLGVPISVGRGIVATTVPHDVDMLRAVRELGLEWQLIFNKGSVMALPTGVNKASGLKAALSELGFSPHAVAGIGDAENDHAFLELCECSVAVSNALPSLKERADWVVGGDHGAGVSELIDQLVENDLIGLESRLERHNIPLGFRRDGTQLSIKAYGSSILVAGTSGGGKSMLTTGFMERLREKEYQFCIVDPEGDYSDLDVVVLGDQNHAPTPSEVIGALMYPDQNLVVNLTGMKWDQRPVFFEDLLPHIRELRAKTGRPHWFIIDEMHHLLPESRDPSPLIPQSMHGLGLVTVHPEHVSRPVLQLVDTIVAIGATPDRTIRSISEILGQSAPEMGKTELAQGEALVWKRGSGERPFWIRSIPAQMERQRHKRKYAEGELPPERSFYFRGPDGKLNLRAQNLQIFLQVADGVDDEIWLHHLSRGDYSSWFETGIKDDELAAAAGEVEKRHPASAAESRNLIRKLVEDRYTSPE